MQREWSRMRKQLSGVMNSRTMLQDEGQTDDEICGLLTGSCNGLNLAVHQQALLCHSV